MALHSLKQVFNIANLLVVWLSQLALCEPAQNPWTVVLCLLTENSDTLFSRFCLHGPLSSAVQDSPHYLYFKHNGQPFRIDNPGNWKWSWAHHRNLLNKEKIWPFLVGLYSWFFDYRIFSWSCEHWPRIRFLGFGGNWRQCPHNFQCERWIWLRWGFLAGKIRNCHNHKCCVALYIVSLPLTLSFLPFPS